MKTSTLLVLAGVGVAAVLVLGRRNALAPASAPAPYVPPERPKSGRDFVAMFDPTSSTSAFGGEVKNVLQGAFGSLFN